MRDQERRHGPGTSTSASATPWTRSTHSMPPSSKRPDNYFTAAPTTHWRPCPASSSSSVTCVRVVGGVGAWAARSRLHQPAMDLKDQTKFRDIPWTREGSAGALLDSA